MSSDAIESFWDGEFEELVNAALDRAPVLSDLRRGRVPEGDPRALLRRHYAEVRTALDLKLPSRIRLCPTESFSAKRFFWRLYAEEQGDFRSEDNHANLFARFSHSLGVTDEELEAEFESYWPCYSYLLTEEPSHAVLVRELTISCVWESVILRLGPNYLQAIQVAFSSSDDDLKYFVVHEVDDAQHSVAALAVLQEYVRDERDLEIVRSVIPDTLVDSNPWSLELESGAASIG